MATSRPHIRTAEFNGWRRPDGTWRWRHMNGVGGHAWFVESTQRWHGATGPARRVTATSIELLHDPTTLLADREAMVAHGFTTLHQCVVYCATA